MTWEGVVGHIFTEKIMPTLQIALAPPQNHSNLMVLVALPINFYLDNCQNLSFLVPIKIKT